MGENATERLSGISLKRDPPRLSETVSLRNTRLSLARELESRISGFSLRRDPPRLSEITSLKMPKLSLEREFVLGKGLSFCNSRLGESSSPGRDQQRTSPSHACKHKKHHTTFIQFVHRSCHINPNTFQPPNSDKHTKTHF